MEPSRPLLEITLHQNAAARGQLLDDAFFRRAIEPDARLCAINERAARNVSHSRP
jgi:hypothetical protein